jgi:hypothetical protein
MQLSDERYWCGHAADPDAKPCSVQLAMGSVGLDTDPRCRRAPGGSGSRRRIKYRINTAGICNKSKTKKVLATRLASGEAVNLKGKKARWR